MPLCQCDRDLDRDEPTPGRYVFPLNDAQGIFCSYVCEECEPAIRAKYRPEMFSGYTQADVDEPIEPDEDY